MRTISIFIFITFLELLSLVGCELNVQEEIPVPSVHFQQEVNPSTMHEESPKSFSANEGGAEEKNVTWVTLSQEEEQSQTVEMSKTVSPENQQVLLTSKLYFSKGGELLGDLTIANHNSMSFEAVTVECVEYNMNMDPVRRALSTLTKSIESGKTVHWDGVNFGYVHDDVHTVQCGIRDVTADLPRNAHVLPVFPST